MTFTWIDIATLVAPTLAITVIVAWVHLNGRNDAKPLWRKIGLWSVPLVFAGATFLVYRWRVEYRERTVCTTANGVRVIDDGGTLPDCAELERYIGTVYDAWRKVPDVAIPEHVSLWVKPLPFQLHGGTGPEYAGYAKRNVPSIAVGMDGRPLAESSLAHELGHVLCRCDEARLAELAKRYGVPR